MAAPCAWYTIIRSPAQRPVKVPLAALSVLLPALTAAVKGQYLLTTCPGAVMVALEGVICATDLAESRSTAKRKMFFILIGVWSILKVQNSFAQMAARYKTKGGCYSYKFAADCRRAAVSDPGEVPDRFRVPREEKKQLFTAGHFKIGKIEARRNGAAHQRKAAAGFYPRAKPGIGFYGVLEQLSGLQVISHQR